MPFAVYQLVFFKDCFVVRAAPVEVEYQRVSRFARLLNAHRMRLAAKGLDVMHNEPPCLLLVLDGVALGDLRGSNRFCVFSRHGSTIACSVAGEAGARLLNSVVRPIGIKGAEVAILAIGGGACTRHRLPTAGDGYTARSAAHVAATKWRTRRLTDRPAAD